MVALFTLAAGIVLSGCSTSVPEAQDPATAAVSPAVEKAFELLRAQDPAAAAELLEEHVAKTSDDSRAWELLGRVHRIQQAPDKALIAFERAVDLDPERWQALYGMAVIHAGGGETAKALELLKRIRKGGKFDLSQITLEENFAELRDEPGFSELLMRPEDFVDPFVEPTRVVHEWQGEAEGDVFGWIARNVGDVDGDGVSDLATSAPYKKLEGEQAGRIYVYSGRSGKLLWTQSGQPGDQFGIGIERAGDVDGDGIPDVFASAPGSGHAYVYAGRSGALLLTLDGEQEDEAFGRHVMGVGDVDGDGRSDLLVGAPQNDGAGEDAGRAALYSGKDGSILKQWLGEEPGDRLGEAVAGRSGEDVTFLILGAPDGGPGEGGRVYVYTDLGEKPYFTIDSDAQGRELGGMFLSVVGDVNADGTLDVYATDWSHAAEGPVTGKVVVHSGANGEELLAITGENAGDGFGIGSGDAGDVDGDGHDDLVVGAWQHNGAAPSGGKVYLYSGRDGSLLRVWTCQVMGDTFGFDTTGMGDVDGDGAIDLLLTSAWSAVKGARSGRMFLVSSR